MDQWKLQRLIEEQQIDPAEVRELPPSEVQALRSRLCDRLGLKPSISDLTLMKELQKRRRPIDQCNAQVEGFDLLTCFARAGVMPEERVYLNWYNFDRVDEVRFDLFRRCLDHFYYPAADDLDILDNHFTWIVAIDHEGCLWIVDLTNSTP
jgi:hypothetical protein